MELIHDGEPAAIGWYAVVICYDANEGAFPDTAYWDGRFWRSEPEGAPFHGEPNCFTSSPFSSEKEAEEWGWANGIGW